MSETVILIAYPKQFLSREKFFRKMNLYTESLQIDGVIAADDPHGFSAEFAASIDATFKLGPSGADLCTHAVIFNHNSIFADAVAALKARNVPGKVIPLALTSVVNKDRGDPFDVYIGRGTVWGNPYPIGRAGDREEVLRMYQYDFDRRFLRFFESESSNIAEIRGKILGCHCKPAACHGDIIANYVNSLDDGE